MKSLKSKLLALASGVGLAFFLHSKPDMEVIDKAPQIDKIDVVYTNHPQIEITKITGASESEVKMIQEAVNLSNRVMKTECFKNAILDGKFTETNGLTNSQILNLITNKKMSIKVEMFTGSFYQNYISKTMGIDKGNGTVYANRFFIKDADEMASVILHEAEGHGQGFHHYDAKNTSVPYQLNNIYDKCSN